MIHYVIAGSGSKGNATFIYSEKTIIQIDMGVTLTALKKAIALTPHQLEDIEALFITHEHSDHVKSLSLAAYKKLNIPIYCGKTTLKKPTHVIKEGEIIAIGDLNILPLKTSHDANYPLGFIISNGEEKLLYMTDTGYIPEEDLPHMKDATHYIIESNHDVEMLKHSGRPKMLINRILSNSGHLSNFDSATYISSLIGEHTKSITLAHLSEECNSPETAIKTWSEVFQEKKLDISKYNLRCAPQYDSLVGGDE